MGGMKLGSLFDGSGGFPLAGVLCGMEPVWASEIEPYPLKVTAARFPNMKQLGDVTKINGAEIEPVDVVTFGSPCQDLSVAGKQAGIHEGQRSNLFFEAIRIIGEMRNATANKFPRFAVWENVPGAFSSNKGQDFKAVIQAFCKVAGAGIPVPESPRGGWKHSGVVVGDGFSLAWRVYDAQYWGVPQRRKRIYLIADFASERAGEILFKPESMQGDFESVSATWKRAAGDVEGGIGRGNQVFGFAWANSGKAGLSCAKKAPPVKAARCGEPGVCYKNVVAFMGGQGANARSIAWKDDGKSPTLKAAEGRSNQVPDVCYCFDARGYGNGQISPALIGDHEERVSDYTVLATYIQPSFGAFEESEKACPLKASDGKRVDPGAVILEKGKRNYIVRRLTPLECCRLQGFPDWWEDGANGSDSARYKMWGNGIALPCAYDVMRRVAHAGELY